MTVLPNLDILVVQRRGEIMLYKHDSKPWKQAGFLQVYWKTKQTPDVNAGRRIAGINQRPRFRKESLRLSFLFSTRYFREPAVAV